MKSTIVMRVMRYTYILYLVFNGDTKAINQNGKGLKNVCHFIAAGFHIKTDSSVVYQPSIGRRRGDHEELRRRCRLHS